MSDLTQVDHNGAALMAQRTIHAMGVIYRERSTEAQELAETLVRRLESAGRHAWACHRADEATITERLPQTDAALVLGGDGTIISVARLCAPLRIPILGVNFGRVGFLTELEPAEVEEKLPLYLDGDYWVDERSMLEARIDEGDPDNSNSHDHATNKTLVALNDVALVRGAEPRVIHIQVWIDDHHYNTTAADGIIISTATGSTAYNLAAGGPILHPQVRSSVITPIAPHLAADRSLIIEPDATITLRLEADSTSALLSADGQINLDVAAGSRIIVRGNAHLTKFLRRRPPTYFYRILSAKLRDNL